MGSVGAMVATHAPAGRHAAGELLRQWRLRRRFSQLDLAVRAEVSTRHLSFVETGRSKPSPEMILHLAEHLEVPLRQRNQLLLAAGYAPRYGQRTLDDPSMAPVRRAVQMVLDAHPYPAIVVDRHWNLVQANEHIGVLLSEVAPWLLEPPVNVIRVALHPDGLARCARNPDEFGTHLVRRLRRMVDASGDAELAALLDEAVGYVGAAAHGPVDTDVVMPLVLALPAGELRTFSTLSTFGTPLDITTDELTIEAFYPSDEDSRLLLERLCAPAHR